MAKQQTLSKSTLIRSIQCQKSLYLYKNFYNTRDKISVSQQQVFDRGHRVGVLAQQLFPNGKDVSPPNPFSYDASIAATKLLVQQQFPVIYEASFKYSGIMVALDILVCKDGKYYAYEVKSSLKISATYLQDAAIQFYIIEKSGIQIEDFFIVNINGNYEFENNLDMDNFFKITSVLEDVKAKKEDIEKIIENAIATLSSKTIPNIKIGQHCTKPYNCDFMQTCWKNIPQNSVYYLPGISMHEKQELIQNNIETIDKINSENTFNERQNIIINAHKNNKLFFDKNAFFEFIKDIKYPLYFFDIEAFQPAIPVFNHTKPFQTIPFLYSLHYKKDARTVEHKSYISTIGNDQREQFIIQFLDDTKTEGSIIVFNTLMEKSILNKLANDFPHYKNDIQQRIDRMIDFEIPFKNAQYYHPKMNGSFSLKTIGNVILEKDEFAFNTIKDGSDAMAVYNELFYTNDTQKINTELKNIEKYCATDTLVLMKVFEKIKLEC